MVEVEEAVRERPHGLEKVGAGTESGYAVGFHREGAVAVRDGLGEAARQTVGGGAADETTGGERGWNDSSAVEYLGEVANGFRGGANLQRRGGGGGTAKEELDVGNELGSGRRLCCRSATTYRGRVGFESVARQRDRKAARGDGSETATGLEEYQSVLH